ncbi:MAG: hypothetical protein BA874_07210 [Desulfuromonadales bacterium C00003068]|nr:MAG: hypothetical protein BA874_07210 [Desulfuromonadales bacterium C00003068]
MSCSSTTKQPMGLINGQLAPCPNSPNCVSSEMSTSTAYIEPLAVKIEPEAAWLCLKRSIEGLGGTIKMAEDHYLWATFKTKVFRFVDDVELRLDADSKLIHVRSASRVGYSDLGVNQKRVELLREKFTEEQERVLKLAQVTVGRALADGF